MNDAKGGIKVQQIEIRADNYEPISNTYRPTLHAFFFVFDKMKRHKNILGGKKMLLGKKKKGGGYSD